MGNILRAVNDYRVLAPSEVTDPNLNRVAVQFNALGMAVATAQIGKGADVAAAIAVGASQIRP